MAGDFVIPNLSSPVVDTAEMMSAETREVLIGVLKKLHDQGGSQIVALTLSDLGGLSIEDASIKIAEQWKLGDKSKDNGIILLVAKEERKVRIEVGYGLEGNLPDAYCKRIIDQAILPLFKEGRIDDGFLVGVYKIIQRTDPNVDVDGLFSGKSIPHVRKDNQRRGRSFSGIGVFLFIILIIFFVVVEPLLNAFIPGYRSMRRKRHFNGGSHGGFGGFGGGFGGGGFGGGGFGGGGGGFGGGGASGGW